MRRTGCVVAALAAVTLAAAPAPPPLEGARYLSIGVEPAKEVVGQCAVPGLRRLFKVLPDDVVRLRVEAVMQDGSYRDLTSDPVLHYVSSNNVAARVTRTGVVKFFPTRYMVQPFFINVTDGRLVQSVGFTVITGSHLDLPEPAQKILDRELSGLHVPEERDVVNDWAYENVGIPFAARGDFDANGLMDFALVLISDREWKIVILCQQAGGGYDLAYSEGGRLGAKGGLTCPQQIHLIALGVDSNNDASPTERAYLRVEIYGGDLFTLRWNGKKFDRAEEDYGE